ncbi:MAG: NADH dehydrogenase (quinone) subunit D [Candidatus Tectomicrobia bacterium]|uniref:NADH-quinone oxidoreductase subunit D n=1 Tax=Tectimicrobiota bacterium TaxID=2528274 RepID=A0A932CNW5_UNCTE|nr:NADH dehydrogenase (quinone) subunit D [Candidatus Tectomicrobia bacterium]
MKTETMTLNVGPQHPSTHGVLRLVMELDGENIVNCTPHIGYLHTGIEKSMEHRTYHQVLPLTDRMDYLSPITNNLAYVLAVEKLLGLEDVPERAQTIRVILSELSRIASHLIALGTHVMEMGAITFFMYGFREREQILDLFETVAGVRMMTSYIRIGGVAADLPPEFIEKLRDFLKIFPSRVDEYETLLTHNPIWLRRTQGVGILPQEVALSYGLTGPNARASGIAWDLRKDEPYCGYERFDFEVPVGERGDVYDRYRVRIAELRQSHRILTQALEGLPPGPYRSANRKVVFPPKDELHASMEALIHHFKLATEGFSPPAGEVYQGVEGPRGEIGFYLVSDGGTRPWRVRVRPPSFLNVQAIPALLQGCLIADAIAAVGSLDFVLGEVDR